MTGATGRVVNLVQLYSPLHVYMYMLRLAQVFIQSPTIVGALFAVAQSTALNS